MKKKETKTLTAYYKGKKVDEVNVTGWNVLRIVQYKLKLRKERGVDKWIITEIEEV